MKHFVTITMKMLIGCFLEAKQNMLNDEIIVSDVKPVNMFVLKLSQITVIWNYFFLKFRIISISCSHVCNLIDFEKIISHGIIFIFILKSVFNVLLMEWVQISK